MIIAANRVNHSFIHVLYGRFAWLLNVCFVGENDITMATKLTKHQREENEETNFYASFATLNTAPTVVK
jgi:hypothetical protein